jgi:aminoglycoside phosphotransferase (APT) family kinase protein
VADTTEPQGTKPANSEQLAHAHEVIHDLGLQVAGDMRPRADAAHSSSILVPCDGVDGRPFLLKFFVPPPEGKYYPAGVRIDDYARREGAFYRYLDSMDPERRMVPAPRTILIDNHDPPRWILVERIAGAVGPAEEVLSMDHVFELLALIQDIPVGQLLGRRDFPLNRWDPVSILERVRLMYDPVLFVIGEDRWGWALDFFKEALRWNESRPQTVVHGDFTDHNILVDTESRPFLLDFERVGIGNQDHDFGWFWIHSERSQEWKTSLLARYWERLVGSERIRSEWGIRSTLVYLALRRLRFRYLTSGDKDPDKAKNLALLDAALAGGSELFPI